METKKSSFSLHMPINIFLQPLNVLFNLRGHGKNDDVSYWFLIYKTNEKREKASVKLYGENLSLANMVTRFADIGEL